MTYALILVALVLTLTGCGGEVDGDGNGEASSRDRCEGVPRVFVRGLTEGLRKGATSVRWVQAVKSEDDIGDFYEGDEVYFISADVQGKGFGGGDDIATWATNGPMRGADRGLLISVNDLAHRASTWGIDAAKGSPVGAVKSMDLDGAQESQDCARAKGG